MKLAKSDNKSRPWLFILEFLLITSAISSAAGLGFGAALRLNRPAEPGGTAFHSDQSFPPREDWPIGQSTQSY
ncbi:hypothetical protein [Crocosphaera sp. XPORK-15E]|uniref:hypothetical protein n=1 Tax=Crocosphaera sp. XPORK-15E TaxID=3110247 RepID=UPI002B21BFD6|nr:hypothetical protein [Crocosphaera sp. XPORK-15E]MEA5536218.1 hypothetical protein [Crocosphaera sp. XPORK-15E]